jgi:hypothetical protein
MAKPTMNEHGARRLALVRAIETEDTAEVVLTRDDRSYATGLALAEVGQASGGRAERRQGDVFLERRSGLAFDRLAARYPAVVQAEWRARWPGWVDWALPVGALVLGLASNVIDGRRLSIIAFPMLGMLLWNVTVYMLLALHGLRRFGRGHQEPRASALGGVVARIAGPARAVASAQQPLNSALGRYLRDWLSWSAPLTRSRAARVLHLSAAAIAAGLLIGMYWRALGTEYRASWESTLLGPQAVHALVHTMLRPASLLTGIALPDVARIEALRWGTASPGENAGPWLHLYAATGFLFIIGPRLVLAGWSALRAARLKRNLPVPRQEDFYVRRLLRSVRSDVTLVRVVPYSFRPPERTQRQLERLLADVLGEKTRMMLEAPISYGGEDEWLDMLDAGAGETDHLLVLFNLSATPESENHGALVTGIRRRLAEAKSGSGLTILIDESAMRQRLGSGAEERVQSRRAAWEAILRQHYATPLFLDLNREPAELASPLEGALLHAHAGLTT